MISINQASKKQMRSFPIFKALLYWVRVNSCEVLWAAALCGHRLKLLMHLIELAPEERASVAESDGGVHTLNDKNIHYDPAKNKAPAG